MNSNKKNLHFEEVKRSDAVEGDIVERTLPFLKPYFNVYREVTSVDGHSRIDLVLVHKLVKELISGVEAKRIDDKRGQSIGEHILQAFRYILSDFIIDGKKVTIPVALLPPLSYNYLIMKDNVLVDGDVEYFSDRHDLTSEHHTVNGILGAFGVGELRKRFEPRLDSYREQLGFWFQNREIWQNKHGCQIDYVHLINYSRALKKINDVRETYKLDWHNGH